MTSYPPYQPRNWHRAIEAQVPQKALRDLINRIRFGADAPQSDERIYIDPRLVTHMYTRHRGHRLRRHHSGQVRPGDWDLSVTPLETTRKYRACVDHFQNGQTWQETGIIDEIMGSIAKNRVFDGCRTKDDVQRRYAEIDALYHSIKDLGRVYSASERPDAFRREHDGVFVHITRTGDAILAGNGNHRLAIAKILGLTSLPAQLGVIHPKALADAHLARLRQIPKDIARAMALDADRAI